MRTRLQCLAGVCLAWGLAAVAVGQQPIHYSTDDGATISADLYASERGHVQAVILAHGGQFTKESWKPQAEKLVAAGFRVLAINFRGFGRSTGPGAGDPLAAPLHLDLLGAAGYLRSTGSTSVFVVGGSLGGMAAGDALLQGRKGEIERVVFLGARASLAGGDVSKLSGCKLFIVAREDLEASGKPRLLRIQADFERVPQPRRMLVVEGDAHAQALFATPQAGRVFDAILDFLEKDCADGKAP